MVRKCNKLDNLKTHQFSSIMTLPLTNVLQLLELPYDEISLIICHIGRIKLDILLNGISTKMIDHL